MQSLCSRRESRLPGGPSPARRGTLPAALHGIASAVRVGSIVYEYRESAIPVPEDVAEQASLARQLLDVRKLTKKERKTYDLELPGEQEEP